MTIRAARSSSPRRSSRATISPASWRRIASGLTSTSVRSTAIERETLLTGPFPPRSRREPDRRRRLDRRFAVGTDLPERLERRLAVHAGLTELRGADGSDEARVVADSCAEPSAGVA